MVTIISVCSIHNVVHLYLKQEGLYLFEKIHTERMGKCVCSVLVVDKVYVFVTGAYYLRKFIGDKCNIYEFLRAVSGVRLMQKTRLIFIYLQILTFEGIATHEQRKRRAKEIYDKFIFADKLAMSSVRLYMYRSSWKGYKVWI